MRFFFESFCVCQSSKNRKKIPYIDQGQNIQRVCQCATDIVAPHSKFKNENQLKLFSSEKLFLFLLYHEARVAVIA
jgi:hypothetical protein